MSVAVESGVLV